MQLLAWFLFLIIANLAFPQEKSIINGSACFFLGRKGDLNYYVMIYAIC